MKVLLVELVDDNGHNYVVGVFTSMLQVRAFMTRNGTPIDEDSKIEECGITFYSTTVAEIAITELVLDKGIGLIDDTKVQTT